MSRDDDLNTIFSLIEARTGRDFSNYKESTMCRRITKRMNIQHMDNLKEYIKYINHNPEEIDQLFHELLINVTRFFRDPEAFNVIKDKALSEIITSKNDGDHLRIWVPGCSNGEEVYSLAMLLSEEIESRGKQINIQIFGTDIDATTIKKARKRVYPKDISEHIGQKRLEKFFIELDEGYQVKDVYRDLAVFAVHDVLKDPPFNRLDMISCRNLLIYLKSHAQKNVLSTFNYALNKEGVLFLGPSESIGGSLKSFQVVDKKWKIFKSCDEEVLPMGLMNSP